MYHSNNLQLTYIPPLYWNSPQSGFELLNGALKLPHNADFFIIWKDPLVSERELSEMIMILFPEIPPQKLLTCRINLSFPPDDENEIKGRHKNDKNLENFYIKSILAKIVPTFPAVKILHKLTFIDDINPEHKGYNNSIKTWSYLTKFIFELLIRGNFIPFLEQKTEKLYEGKWQLLMKSEKDNERFNLITKNSSWETHNLPADFIKKSIEEKDNKDQFLTSGMWHPLYLFSLYLDNVGNDIIRYFLKKDQFRTFKDFYNVHERNISQNLKTVEWDYKFLNSIIGKNIQFTITKFHESIVPEIINNWANTSQIFHSNRNVLFKIHLELPEKTESEWPLQFSLNLRSEEKEIGIIKAWNDIKVYNKYFSKFFKDRATFIEYILRSYGIISKIFPPIRNHLKTEIPEKLLLSSAEVMDFLKYPKDLLIQSGFDVIVPEVFTKGGAQRLSTHLLIKSSKRKEKIRVSSGNLPSMFDMNTLLEYKWQISLENQELTQSQKNMILTSQAPLINVNDKWILIDKEDFQTLNSLSKKKVVKDLGLNPDGTIHYLSALKLGLSGQALIHDEGEPYEVIIEGQLSQIIDRLQFQKGFNQVGIPESFQGTLREYQKEGLMWLVNMCDLNFGVCLADDMGLGKTIEIIAYLLYRQENNQKQLGGTLIICPTSVLFNWQREIEKFGPSLKYKIHHGPDRISNLNELKEYTTPNLIILSTYGTIRNDIDLLEKISYQGIIVDESQNIKNYDAKQTKAVHRLQGQYKACLSGTPIENRLLELWSLFEFLNPGLLGNRTQFQKKYVIPIERYQDKEAIQNLRAIINPFILRRVKTDKSIIKDLPEKNEMKIYIKLTEQQSRLYKKAVDDTLNEMESLGGDKFKSTNLILGLLVKLKQICNHPYQYLKKENIDIEIEDFIVYSNKLERLVEMTDEIISKGEKIIIFTQFKKMGDLILSVFKELYSFNILFFHGSVPEKKRREIVDEFQSISSKSAPILILSLKAGGTGLNLTQGTTVFHFDRWWNPSVEKQATDRAYRIGQTHTVNVYKFITLGTIEEKIDILLEEKKELTDSIITSSGEGWITGLDINKIKKILTLTE